jgi:NADH dehydrogenase
MTVIVTGASGPVGHALVPLLVRLDEVRAAVRRPEAAEPLRTLGAKVTVGRLDDADALAEVFRGVYTVIHLVGGPNQPDDEALWDANHGSVLRALAAAREAGVHRFVLVSVPGAAPEAAEPFLRARGLAEEAVMTSGLEHAVVRSTHAYGVGSLWFTAMVEGAMAVPPVVVGDGRQEIAPVSVEDLARVLAAIDDRRGPLEGTWALEGPDVVSVDELAAILTGDAAEPMHVRGSEARATLQRLLDVDVSAATVAYVASSSRADAADAAREFGVVPTSLVEGMRRTLERAAEAISPGAG